MIGKLEEHEIILAEVPFQDVDETKWRPAYVLKLDDKLMFIYKITTKFHDKSNFIQSKYFEIIDWLKAGLREPSWIDTINIIRMPRDDTKIHFIGYLTREDKKRLVVFLSNSNK